MTVLDHDSGSRWLGVDRDPRVELPCCLERCYTSAFHRSDHVTLMMRIAMCYDVVTPDGAAPIARRICLRYNTFYKYILFALTGA